MNLKKKKMYFALTLIVALLLVVGAVSFAYFTSQVEKINERAVLTTATARVTFSDNDAGITANLGIEESITKKFKIQNTGTVDVKVKMYWKDLINSYVLGSLTYTLLESETETGNYREVVEKTNVPKSDKEQITEELSKTLTIPVGKTYYYELVIKNNNLENVDQTTDFNAKFVTRFTIQDDSQSSQNNQGLIANIKTQSKGVRTNFDNPSPLPGEGEYKVKINSNYKNLINIVNDETYPYSYDEEKGVYTSTNKIDNSKATITFSPSKTNEYYICYEASTQSYYDKGTIYLDNVLKRTFSGTEQDCINIGEIGSSNQIKITYAKDSGGSSGNDEIKISLASDVTIEKTPDTDSGIYEMEDDYGISYYFRGAVENNYVKYGKWNSNTPDVFVGYYSESNDDSEIYNSLSECQTSYYNFNCTKISRAGQDMWWRIIRINGDGSLRIIYDGIQGYSNGTSNIDRFIITDQPFNNDYTDAKYLGWMYGPAGSTASTSKIEAQSNIADSEAKKVVDTWYKTNIVDTGYGASVSDKIFCNDRSFHSGLGYGSSSMTEYGASVRLRTSSYKPSFVCPQQNDAFTVSDTVKGNGALTYPVGLITADEIVAAGAGESWTGNSKYYLYKSSRNFQFSLSPSSWVTMGANAYIFGVSDSGSLSSASVNSGAVAPVINLSPEYADSMIGTGTIDDPYRANE